MNNKSKYQIKKEKAREKILEKVNELFDEYLVLSWYELQIKYDELYTLSKRYGFIKELKENWII